MKYWGVSRIVVPVYLLASFGIMVHAAEFDHSHAKFDIVLKQHLKNSLLDYRAIKSRPAELDRYLVQLESVSSKEFKAWTNEQQWAFLINLYNARTIRLITDHYPLESIRNIGWLPGAAGRKKIVLLFGKKVSLEHIEHGILRKQYSNPAIHFALVCAAKGCPPLRSEAYRADKLEKQLSEQGRTFLSNPLKNRVDAPNRRVYLSPIFKWFAADSEKKSGSVLAYLKPLFPKEQSKRLADDFTIEYTDDDWSLNQQ